MNITFNVDMINNGEGVIITNTSSDFTSQQSNTLVLNFAGSLSGNIISYSLTPTQKTAFLAKTPISLLTSVLSYGKVNILPDDFYRIQICEYEGTLLNLRSNIATLCSYSYVQKVINDKIVHTERISGGIEKMNIHAMIVHLRAIESLGNNPPISMENTLVSRIKYLKSI